MLTPPEAKAPLPSWFPWYAGILTLAAVVGTAGWPWLATEQPVLLVALTGDGTALIAGAASAPFWVLLVLGSARRAMSMVMLYVLTRQYGDRGMAWAKQRWRWMESVERWTLRIFGRAGSLLLVIAPNHGTAVLAGMSGFSWRQFMPAMVLGQVLFTAFTLVLGEWLAAFIAPGLAWIDTYKWECTAVTATAVLVHQLWKRLSARRKLVAAQSSLET